MYYVPPTKILYQDHRVTYYIQDKCTPFVGIGTEYHGIHVLLCLLLISSDIGRHNWGLIDDKCYIYDWQNVAI